MKAQTPLRRAAVPFALLACLSFPACEQAHEENHAHEHHTIVVTSPKAMDVTIDQRYVCQIHSQNHINIQALEGGYLEAIPIMEGQAVKRGDVMFQVLPNLLKARLQTEEAEVKLAELEYKNTKKLNDEGQVVSQQEVFIYQAKLARAEAKLKLAQAELDFATVKAPFDGVVDRMLRQKGSLVKEGDDLTTLSDNSMMWVYFNVPEKRYLEYMADGDRYKGQQIELVLANGKTFPEAGGKVTVETEFNNETGNIKFRVDFPNPTGLLRHGQTGNVVVSRVINDAIVIPQRATFEVLDKRFVLVVGEDHVVRQRAITVLREQEDIFLIDKGLGVTDKFVLEGVRQVHDGDTVEYEFRKPEDALAHPKHHAE